MNRNYNAGRRFEYARKKFWESKGYTVLRTAGSHGAFDLVVIGKDDVFLVQCKRFKSPSAAKLHLEYFKKNPPLPAGNKHYVQGMEVSVVGSKDIMEVWV